MLRMKTLGGLFACFALVAFLTGCGGAPDDLPELAKVTGRVTKGNQPVEGVIVTFMPEEGALSTGITDADGRFELRYSQEHFGAVPGKHTVKLSKMEGDAGAETIPAKFNENSTDVREVTKDGPNDFEIKM